MNQQMSRVATCLAHVILAAVSGWSLKYVPSPASTRGVPLVYAMLCSLLAYSVLGIVRYSHPQPGNVLRLLYDQLALLTKVCPLPVLNAQLYLQQVDQLGHLVYLGPERGLGYAFLLLALIAYAVCNIFSDLNRRHIGERVATGVLLLNALGLGVISGTTGNYWASGLVVSFVSKHFLLPVLAERYQIPHALLYTYGLSFYEVFGVNAVAEAQTLMAIKTR
uniref:Uncharacterized protein n=1 Tax=Anopheles farauti TaxID=69004 RepID=A0A182Q1B0_9DIPT